MNNNNNVNDNSTQYDEKQNNTYKNNDFELKTSGYSETMWYEQIPKPLKFDKLNQNISSSESIDIAIVGGGISGLSTAYLLSKSGQKVILFSAITGKVINGPANSELEKKK